MGRNSIGSLAKFTGFCLASSIILSGCVSGDTSTSLADGSLTSEIALASNTQADSIVSTSNAASSEMVDEVSAIMASLQNIPVPETSPRSATAYTANSTQSEVTDAQVAVANQIITPESDAANVSESSNSIDDGQQLAFAKAAPPRKPTFIEIMAERKKQAELAKQQRQQLKIQQARARVTNSKTTLANKQDPSSLNVQTASTAALPGVKKGNALFDINGEDHDEEVKANVRVASIGSLGRTISATGLIKQTSSVEVDCFKPELFQILKTVERRFGKKVMVTSGYRNPSRNRRAGGVKNSTHVYCKAADIQVPGVSKWKLAKYLRTIPGRGGVGTYCRTKSVHIDVGSQREWHQPCRRGKKKSRKRI